MRVKDFLLNMSIIELKLKQLGLKQLFRKLLKRQWQDKWSSQLRKLRSIVLGDRKKLKREKNRQGKRAFGL